MAEEESTGAGVTGGIAVLGLAGGGTVGRGLSSADGGMGLLGIGVGMMQFSVVGGWVSIVSWV